MYYVKKLFLYLSRFIEQNLIYYSAKMAHWFHRNPLKATAPTNFEVKMVVQDVEALKVLRYVELETHL